MISNWGQPGTNFELESSRAFQHFVCNNIAGVTCQMAFWSAVHSCCHVCLPLLDQRFGPKGQGTSLRPSPCTIVSLQSVVSHHTICTICISFEHWVHCSGVCTCENTLLSSLWRIMRISTCKKGNFPPPLLWQQGLGFATPTSLSWGLHGDSHRCWRLYTHPLPFTLEERFHF